MSEHIAGTEVYYLDNILNAVERMAESIESIAEMEKALYAQSIKAIAEKTLRERQQEQTEISRLFGEAIALAERPHLAQSVIGSLDENILARLARAFSVLQDEIHELAMRKLKESEVAKGAVTHENLDEVEAPFVAIVPK